MASVAYTSALADAPPAIGRAGWLGWMQRLLTYRRAECPSARATTYYFVHGAVDPLAVGTEDDPFLAETAAELQTAIDAVVAPGVRLLLRRGDAWEDYSGHGLQIATDDVTVDAWGDGDEPWIIHGTETIAGVAGTWADIGGGKYSTTLGSSEMSGKTLWQLLPDWTAAGGVRALARQTLKYERVALVGEVVSAGQYHYNAGTRVLTIYPLASAGVPTGTNHRIVTHDGTGHNVRVGNVTGVRISNGAAIGTGGQATQAWGFAWEGGGTKVCYVDHFTAIYNALHNFGQYYTGAGLGGGYLCGEDIVAGWCNDETAIPITIYNFGGSQEAVLSGVEIYGYQIDANNNSARIRCSQAWYSHTNGGGIIAALMILHDAYIWAGRGGCNAIGWAGDPPNTASWRAAGTVGQCRVYLRDLTLDCDAVPTSINTGNQIEWLGTRAGHAEANVYILDLSVARITAGIEFVYVYTTDYDHTGWSYNRRVRAAWPTLTGSHTLAFVRNNLTSGTYPNKPGTVETYMIFPSFEIEIAAGYTNTGFWGQPCFSQSANETVVAGLLGATDAHSNMANWLNGVIACDNKTGNSARDFLFGPMKGDPRTDGIYTDGFLATCPGGVANCYFFGLRSADLSTGGFIQHGTATAKASFDCADLAALPDLRLHPTATSPLVGSLGALPSHADRIEYDADNHPRDYAATTGARGAFCVRPPTSDRGAAASRLRLRL